MMPISGKSRIAVLVPTRDRPFEFIKCLQSADNLATNPIKVFGYLDEDDVRGLDIYADCIIGPRVGSATAMNMLASEAILRYPEVDTLVMMTDDALMETPGWDDFLLSELDKFPKRLGVVSPHLSRDDGAHRVDMPSISKELFQFLGFYAHPRFMHFFWPGVLDAISEGLCLTKATKEQYSIHHGNMSPQRDREFNFDAVQFGKWYAWDKATLRSKLEAEIKGEA